MANDELKHVLLRGTAIMLLVLLVLLLVVAALQEAGEL